jgi:hypothetical protein
MFCCSSALSVLLYSYLREHMIKKKAIEWGNCKGIALWFVVTCFFARDMTFGQIAFAQCSDLKRFRGIEWGQHISTIHQEDLEFHLEDGTMKYFVRKGEKLEVGDVSVETILYGFWRDKFMEVKIYVYAIQKEALKELASVFGEDYEEESKNTSWFYCQHSYIWDKPRTRITLVGPPTRVDKETGTCIITITSKKVLAEKKTFDYSHLLIQ